LCPTAEKTHAKTDSVSLWDTMGHAPSPKQRAFLRYLTAILVDLVILNLFIESRRRRLVHGHPACRRAVAGPAEADDQPGASGRRLVQRQAGAFAKFMRFFSAWLLLFGFKFVILEAIAFAFGDRLLFGGRFPGIVALIVVVVSMRVAEALIVKFHRSLR
jgi:hypothetical protein